MDNLPSVCTLFNWKGDLRAWGYAWKGNLRACVYAWKGELRACVYAWKGVCVWVSASASTRSKVKRLRTQRPQCWEKYHRTMKQGSNKVKKNTCSDRLKKYIVLILWTTWTRKCRMEHVGTCDEQNQCYKNLIVTKYYMLDMEIWAGLLYLKDFDC